MEVQVRLKQEKNQEFFKAKGGQTGEIRAHQYQASDATYQVAETADFGFADNSQINQIVIEGTLALEITQR